MLLFDFRYVLMGIWESNRLVESREFSELAPMELKFKTNMIVSKAFSLQNTNHNNCIGFLKGRECTEYDSV